MQNSADKHYLQHEFYSVAIGIAIEVLNLLLLKGDNHQGNQTSLRISLGCALGIQSPRYVVRYVVQFGGPDQMCQLKLLKYIKDFGGGGRGGSLARLIRVSFQ